MRNSYKSGGPWQTKATIPMQSSENALTVRMVTLLVMFFALAFVLWMLIIAEPYK